VCKQQQWQQWQQQQQRQQQQQWQQQQQGHAAALVDGAYSRNMTPGSHQRVCKSAYLMQNVPLLVSLCSGVVHFEAADLQHKAAQSGQF
jgi:transcription initiation factor TFIID subunit TAF12